MRAYIAGPMRGHQHLNFPAFDSAAQWLRSSGAEIVSPAEMDRDLYGWPALPDPDVALNGFDYEHAMRRDFEAIDTCDTLILLPGWETSQGACRELEHARRQGHYIYTYDPTHRHSRLAKLALRHEPQFRGFSDTSVDLLDASRSRVVDLTYRTGEQNQILGTFLDLLAGPTGDGAGKRSAGLKPSWKVDQSHFGAAHRHIERWRDGEEIDKDSGCHPLVHAAWRLLAVAHQELAARHALPGEPA